MANPHETSRGELLLVDDSASSLAYLSTMLEQAGYLVRGAPSGELALRTLEIRKPELILLDVRMPILDGFEVCRRIKANSEIQDIPIIFLSAQNETLDKVMGLKVGAVDFLGKTFAEEEMLARIDTHIALGRIKKTLQQERASLEDKVRTRTEELRRSQALLLTAIDSGPDWIYAVDRDNRYLLVNRNMSGELGFMDPTELIGRFDCEVFTHEECFDTVNAQRCKWRNGDTEVFAGAQIYKAMEELKLPCGNSVCFETYKTPLRDSQGEIYGLLCFRRNISQRVAMEAEKRQLEQALWQAQKMQAIGLLAGGIAHDFNHLLSLILGYAQFAKTALLNDRTDKLEGYLSEILKAGSEGQAVVNQLLAFSRTDEVAHKAIQIAPLLRENLALLTQAMGESITTELKLPPDLPAVLIKPTQLKQVLTNLILNARDALPGRGHIRISAQHTMTEKPLFCSSCRKPFQGRYLCIEVEDNGAGIPEDIQDKIFDPFFTTKDIGKGSGLGLPMVHGIIHSAGGHIHIANNNTGGTKFSLWIPVSN